MHALNPQNRNVTLEKTLKYPESMKINSNIFFFERAFIMKNVHIPTAPSTEGGTTLLCVLSTVQSLECFTLGKQDEEMNKKKSTSERV